jgi:uncharacterized repeat protein (TIGR04138 family)
MTERDPEYAPADQHSVINEDLPCEDCGYNLRGLREGHRCPECGALIPSSPEYAIDPETAEQFRGISESIGVPEPAVWFVFDAVSFTIERAAVARGRRVDVNAELLKWGVRDFALDYFGTPQEARRRLDRISLRRSEDFARVIFALVETRLLDASPKDGPEAFVGLFTLETLFVI